ncbi:MAG: hypothetical protein A2Y40_02425 [Candidatus Margulisbacteria bacterium GWF2_35_9]|nr:MAG: hypothetical protein A2Y40_02425 [Candidatus Margulisbacteria bacterium GWF2_35_9]
MILVLGLILVYFVATLPGIKYALTQIEGSKPLVRFKLNEKVKVLQYMEFYQFWYVVSYEIIKIIVLIMVLRAENYFLLLAFFSGIVFPFWQKDNPRETGIFPLIFILYQNIWFGIVFGLLHGFGLIKRRKTNTVIETVFFSFSLLLFWVLNYDMLIIYQTMTLIVFQLVHLLVSPAKTSEK